MAKKMRLFMMILFFSASAEAEFDIFLTQKLDLPKDVPAVPTDLETLSHKVAYTLVPGDSSPTIVAKTIDQSIAYMWDKSGIKNTALGQAVEAVQNKMQADVDLGATKADDSKTEVKHKLTLKVMAAQALAQLEYFGWFKCALRYNANLKSTDTEIIEDLSGNKSLILGHSILPTEQNSRISLQWNW